MAAVIAVRGMWLTRNMLTAKPLLQTIKKGLDTKDSKEINVENSTSAKDRRTKRYVDKKNK